MCALLGNLADNAVEACAKVKEQPFLRLYIGLYKGQLYISCTNATSEAVRKLDADYVTKKTRQSRTRVKAYEPDC